MAAVCDFLRILKCLQGIREEPPHLLFTLYIILAAFVTHPVLIRKLLSRLKTKQDVMRLFILRIGIVDVIGSYQLNSRLFRQTKKALVGRLLLAHPVILQLQEKVPFSENILILVCGFLGLFIKTPHQILLHLSGQTGTQSDDPAAVLPQKLFIHTRLVVIPFRKPSRYNLHQVVVSLIIFRQKDKVVIPVIIVPCLTVKPGTRSHIYLTSKDRIDPRLLCFFIKIDHTVHHTVIRNGGTVHAEFLHTRDILLDLVGTV